MGTVAGASVCLPAIETVLTESWFDGSRYGVFNEAPMWAHRVLTDQADAGATTPSGPAGDTGGCLDTATAQNCSAIHLAGQDRVPRDRDPGSGDP